MLEFTRDSSADLHAFLGYRSARDAVHDPRGRTVRQAPWRRTAMLSLPSGGRVYCKHRHGRWAEAQTEWQVLAALRGLGLQVPKPVFLARSGRDSVLGLVGVPGRPVDALLAEGGDPAWVLAAMAPVVARLHGAGWVYRDLYWNHVFAAPGDRLYLVDVERAFQPAHDFERWRVKDLAGLVSSWPAGVVVSRSAALRFLRDALGGRPARYRPLVRRVLAKADRIRGHVTRYPG